MFDASSISVDRSSSGMLAFITTCGFMAIPGLRYAIDRMLNLV